MKTSVFRSETVRRILKALVAAAFIGFVAFSAFELMGRSLFKPQMLQHGAMMLPVLFL